MFGSSLPIHKTVDRLRWAVFLKPRNPRRALKCFDKAAMVGGGMIEEGAGRGAASPTQKQGPLWITNGIC